MRIALYSELSRACIVKARAVIADQHIEPTQEGMRYFRDHAAELVGGKTHKELAGFADYFYMSECRDLLFHVQEHRLTIPQIAEMLDRLGLEFLEFYLPQDALTLYDKMFKNDPERRNLEQWNRFEMKHPETFKIMYRFWCQKSDK